MAPGTEGRGAAPEWVSSPLPASGATHSSMQAPISGSWAISLVCFPLELSSPIMSRRLLVLEFQGRWGPRLPRSDMRYPEQWAPRLRGWREAVRPLGHQQPLPLHLAPQPSAHLLLLLHRVLFPVRPNTPEAPALLPAGLPENAGSHGN